MFLICGPLPMIDAVRGTLAELGVAAERIRWEAFEAAAAVAKSRRAERLARRQRRLSPGSQRARDRGEPSETLSTRPSAPGGRISSLLPAGMCGTCRTRLVSGEVRCDAEALSTAERESGYVLPCVAWAAGDCVLEA